MPNPKKHPHSPTPNPPTPPPHLPTYIPLPLAAARAGITEIQLLHLAECGKLHAIQTVAGEILMDENCLDSALSKEQLIAQKFGHLQGQAITLTDAAAKYDVSRGTLQMWLYKYEYLRVAEDSYPLKVAEDEVAYCADIFHIRKAKGIKSGIPLLDDNGLPNTQLAHPELSKKRKSRRKKEG